MNKIIMLFLSVLLTVGCAERKNFDENSILIEREKTRQSVERTKRFKLKTSQFEKYYESQNGAMGLLAPIAQESGPAATVAAAGIPPAAPAGSVFKDTSAAVAAAGISPAIPAGSVFKDTSAAPAGSAADISPAAPAGSVFKETAAAVAVDGIHPAEQEKKCIWIPRELDIQCGE